METSSTSTIIFRGFGTSEHGNHDHVFSSENGPEPLRGCSRGSGGADHSPRQESIGVERGSGGGGGGGAASFGVVGSHRSSTRSNTPHSHSRSNNNSFAGCDFGLGGIGEGSFNGGAGTPNGGDSVSVAPSAANSADLGTFADLEGFSTHSVAKYLTIFESDRGLENNSNLNQKSTDYVYEHQHSHNNGINSSRHFYNPFTQSQHGIYSNNHHSHSLHQPFRNPKDPDASDTNNNAQHGGALYTIPGRKRGNHKLMAPTSPAKEGGTKTISAQSLVLSEHGSSALEDVVHSSSACHQNLITKAISSFEETDRVVAKIYQYQDLQEEALNYYKVQREKLQNDLNSDSEDERREGSRMLREDSRIDENSTQKKTDNEFGREQSPFPPRNYSLRSQSVPPSYEEESSSFFYQYLPLASDISSDPSLLKKKNNQYEQKSQTTHQSKIKMSQENNFCDDNDLTDQGVNLSGNPTNTCQRTSAEPSGYQKSEISRGLFTQQQSCENFDNAKHVKETPFSLNLQTVKPNNLTTLDLPPPFVDWPNGPTPLQVMQGVLPPAVPTNYKSLAIPFTKESASTKHKRGSNTQSTAATANTSTCLPPPDRRVSRFMPPPPPSLQAARVMAVCLPRAGPGDAYYAKSVPDGGSVAEAREEALRAIAEREAVVHRADPKTCLAGGAFAFLTKTPGTSDWAQGYGASYSATEGEGAPSSTFTDFDPKGEAFQSFLQVLMQWYSRVARVFGHNDPHAADVYKHEQLQLTTTPSHQQREEEEVEGEVKGEGTDKDGANATAKTRRNAFLRPTHCLPESYFCSTAVPPCPRPEGYFDVSDDDVTGAIAISSIPKFTEWLNDAQLWWDEHVQPRTLGYRLHSLLATTNSSVPTTLTGGGGGTAQPSAYTAYVYTAALPPPPEYCHASNGNSNNNASSVSTAANSRVHNNNNNNNNSNKNNSNKNNKKISPLPPPPPPPQYHSPPPPAPAPAPVEFTNSGAVNNTSASSLYRASPKKGAAASVGIASRALEGEGGTSLRVLGQQQQQSHFLPGNYTAFTANNSTASIANAFNAAETFAAFVTGPSGAPAPAPASSALPPSSPFVNDHHHHHYGLWNSTQPQQQYTAAAATANQHHQHNHHHPRQNEQPLNFSPYPHPQHSKNNQQKTNYAPYFTNQLGGDVSAGVGMLAYGDTYIGSQGAIPHQYTAMVQSPQPHVQHAQHASSGYDFMISHQQQPIPAAAANVQPNSFTTPYF